MTAKARKKKWLLAAGALVLTGAAAAGIWLATRGGGEPVNVYSFQNIGMTEFWGDAQESYGPVTTDKIQTEFLSDTQTVTEVAVKDGDTVKKGDILFSFDTTLDALSLERKRLEVEKIKVQIKAAEERLGEVRNLTPYVPPEEKAPEEEDLGEQLKDQLYKISENHVYDGSKPETALICWLKDDTPVSDAILQALYETSLQYREENAQKQEEGKQEESAASNIPESQAESPAPPVPPADPEQPPQEKTYTVPGYFTCNGVTVEPDDMVVGKDGYQIRDSYTYQGKTYWLESAIPKNSGAVLDNLKIPAYPQTERGQAEWEALWEDGVEVKYMREVSITGNQLQNNAFAPIEKDSSLKLEVDKNAVLMFQPRIGNPPAETKLEFSVTPSDGILSVAYEEGNLILSGTPEELTSQEIPYTVKARYFSSWLSVKKYLAFTV